MRNTIRILCLVVLASLLPSTGSAQDTGASREFSSIVEEQGLLLRQIGRLRNTMDVLLKSLEAEGREATADILRNALKKLDERTELGADGHALTMEERMDRIHESLGKRQLIQSLARQRELVVELEALLSILLNRKDLESLEKKIDELRHMQESIKQLVGREAELQQATQELRSKSANETQRELEAGLQQLRKQQAQLLRENEKLGRESGSLELERLEQALAQLLAKQRQDAQMLAAWNPAEDQQLSDARAPLNKALRAEQRAANLDQTQDTLRSVSQALAAANDEGDLQGLDKARLDALTERVKAALKAAQERANLSKEEASLTQAAEALEQARQAMAEAQAGQEATAAAIRDIESARQALSKSAEKAREEAQAARAETREALQPLAESKSIAGQEARAINEFLEKAENAAQRQDAKQASGATAEAMAQLDRARSDLENLAEALSGAQEAQAQDTQRLERGLKTMPLAETQAGNQASEALQQAAKAMQAASSAARQGKAEAAAEKAEAAQAALDQALASVSESREQAAGQQKEAQATHAQAQQEAAKEAEKLGQLAQSASMNEAGKQATQEALKHAQQAMQQAQEDLAQGRSASAAQSQREAMSQLGQAQKSAEESVSPESAGHRAEAESLAQEQARIRQDILDLAKRIADRENPAPTPNMESAQQAAQQAEQSLEEGDLSGAMQEEQKVIQELEQTSQQLEKEEEQYQTLRDEEKLFALAEELQTMLDTHLEQMSALKAVDAERGKASDPSRAQRLQLRRIAREEETLSTRCREMSSALAEEGSTVSALLLSDTADDLERVGQALSDRGEYETGGRTQALQRDVEETMKWILDALKEEQERRKDPEQQKKKQQEEEQEQQDQGKESLIPDTAELKLLRRMEVRVQKSIELILELNSDLDKADKLDRRVLRDVERLALQHSQITEQFTKMRERLGIPAE